MTNTFISESQDAPFTGRKALVVAHTGFQKDFGKLVVDVTTEIRRFLERVSGANGKIDEEERTVVLGGVGKIVDAMFLGSDNRSAYGGSEGNIPLAPYPRLLNKWYAQVTARVVISHYKMLRSYLYDDQFAYLAKGKALTSTLDRQQEARSPYGGTLFQRLFKSNPLAEYESMHTWVDPAGYRLSDRIWQVSKRTRDKIDRLVSIGIAEGRSNLEIAKMVERFMHPARRPFRTTKPYGKDASFDAMRLARTEISRAHAWASYVASRTNPFVTGVDWALSPSHPKTDVCDRMASLGMSNDRLKDPYPLTGAPLPPAHPHCLCRTQPYMGVSNKQVYEEMYKLMNEFPDEATVVNPARPDILVEFMIKAPLMRDVLALLGAVM